MFKLIDTFNNRTISLHRTLDAAVRASDKHSKSVRQSNGGNSYIPKQIVEEREGEEFPVAENELYAAERRVFQ